MRVSIAIEPKDLDDLIITAVEGGYTRNWAALRSYNPNSTKGVTAVLRENGERDEDKRVARVNRATMLRGLQRCARADVREGGWALSAWLRDRTGDAIIADVILQFGIFGEVKYG